jgi:hypothetical protein
MGPNSAFNRSLLMEASNQAIFHGPEMPMKPGEFFITPNLALCGHVCGPFAPVMRLGDADRLPVHHDQLHGIAAAPVVRLQPIGGADT